MKLEGRKVPPFLKPFAHEMHTRKRSKSATGHNKRQIRHV